MKFPSKWNDTFYQEFQQYLLSLGSEKKRQFDKKIIYTKEAIIGINTPVLRDIAKQISKTDIFSFLCHVENRYYEETLIEGFVIGQIKDKKTFLRYFMPYVSKIDNWATCDMVVSSLKIIKKEEGFFQIALSFLESLDDEFICRVGVVMLMDYFLDEEHLSQIFVTLQKIETEFYYVRMAIAWLISIAYIKYPKLTLDFLKKNCLDDFTHNKAIQKIIESKRVGIEQKEMLKLLKRKK